MSSKHGSKKQSRTSSHGKSSSSKTASSSKSKSGRHHAAAYFPTFPTTVLSLSQSGDTLEGWQEEVDEHAGANGGDGGDHGYYMNYPIAPHHDSPDDAPDDDFDYALDGDANSHDNDSHFFGEEQHYPDSMTSSVRAHVWEGGFRYHAYRDGRYCFPNDEEEQNRDDMKHELVLSLCDGRLFYAPVKDRLAAGANVLDLGE